MQKKSSDLDVARQFVDRINSHDTNGLAALMTDDHVFIDSLGEKVSRPTIEEGWRKYFAMVPDYWIRVDRTAGMEDGIILIGAAGGTFVSSNGALSEENAWETPAVWVATISKERISSWRIYADNEPIRSKMRKSYKIGEEGELLDAQR